MTLDLFSGSSSGAEKVPAPLADRMPPRSLKDFVGQERLLEGKGPTDRPGDGRVAVGDPLSRDPGAPKPTLAFLLAERAETAFPSGGKEAFIGLRSADHTPVTYSEGP